MSNLIVLSQSIPCIFVRFNVRVEYESLVKNCEEQRTSQLAREWTTCERLREKHMLEAEELSVRRHLATYLTTRPTCEMTCEMHC